MKLSFLRTRDLPVNLHQTFAAPAASLPLFAPVLLIYWNDAANTLYARGSYFCACWSISSLPHATSPVGPESIELQNQYLLNSCGRSLAPIMYIYHSNPKDLKTTSDKLIRFQEESRHSAGNVWQLSLNHYSFHGPYDPLNCTYTEGFSLSCPKARPF